MTTNGTFEDDGINTTTTAFIENTSTENKSWLEKHEFVFTIVVPLSAIVFLIIVLACYILTIYCRNSGNKHRKLNQTETCDLYQNSTTIRERLAGDSLEVLVNRPLPQPPENNRESAIIPAVPEDDYFAPINLDQFLLRHMEEIQNLPPAPPVFPEHLERLPLDGEGAYIPVIADDEALLLSPGPMHEIIHNPDLCEPSEESGYMVPRSPTQTSLKQNVTETDYSPDREK